MDANNFNERKTLGVISLGCDKNRVDSEKLMALVKDDFILTSDISEAQIIVVNTCAFLESSRKEAIDTIIECAAYKQNGKLEKLVVTGCLPQRFIGELFDDLTEADAFLGTFDYDLFKQTIKRCYCGERVNNVGGGKRENTQGRLLTTSPHYAYLKIADGCNNRCAYCLIPSIRGPYKSEPMEQLISEAENLGDLSELILVAQDVTRYGIDLYKKKTLVELIQKLTALPNIEKVRLLYCYPDMIDDALINELACNDKLIKYLDIPLQHASERILKSMNRRGNAEKYLELIGKLKKAVPGIALRSTFIAGFPGETLDDVEVLKDFLKKVAFCNAGFFAYSREQGTASYGFDGQVKQRDKTSRVKSLYSVQKQISKENLARYKGQTLSVVCDGINYAKQCFEGRAYFQAPEIDGKVFFTADNGEVVNQGETYNVTITKTGAYDLYGRIK